MPSFEGRRPTRGRGIQNHEAALGAENQLRVLQAPQVHLGSEVEAGRRATGGEHPCQRRLAALPGPEQCRHRRAARCTGELIEIRRRAIIAGSCSEISESQSEISSAISSKLRLRRGSAGLTRVRPLFYRAPSWSAGDCWDNARGGGDPRATNQLPDDRDQTGCLNVGVRSLLGSLVGIRVR